MTKIIILTMALIFVGGLFVPVFAEEYEVKIVVGNIDPTCIETQCYDPTTISINREDTIVWNNEDIPAHTIVSGSPFVGQDGYFDSGLILPNKTFKQTFVNDGEYPYYCVLHPWATGTIIVAGEQKTKTTVDEETGEETVTTVPPDQLQIDVDDPRSVRVLDYIGQKVGDGTSFKMSYISQGEITTSFVNQANRYVLFTFSTPAPEGDEIIMKLHEEMIVNPNFVDVNGIALDTYNYGKQGQYNILMFKAPAETWEIKVYGTQVIPEFGTVAFAILAVAIVSIIIVSTKSRIFIPNNLRY